MVWCAVSALSALGVNKVEAFHESRSALDGLRCAFIHRRHNASDVEKVALENGSSHFGTPSYRKNAAKKLQVVTGWGSHGDDMCHTFNTFRHKIWWKNRQLLGRQRRLAHAAPKQRSDHLMQSQDGGKAARGVPAHPSAGHVVAARRLHAGNSPKQAHCCNERGSRRHELARQATQQ
jgi:hypothetical protein